MKIKSRYGIIIICMLLFLFLCIFLPPGIAKFRDKKIIRKIYTKELPQSNAGYRYQLSDLERVIVFSKARENLSATQRYNSQSLITEYLRVERASNYSRGDDAQFILFVNQKGSGIDEHSKDEIMEICKIEVEKLIELSILPEKDINFQTSSGELFSIVNAEDPAMNITVWELSSGQGGENGRWQFEIDAQTGRIYDFNISLEEPFIWDDIDTDAIVENFCDYLGLPKPSKYLENDMLEKTPYYQKYIVELEDDVIIITIGIDPGNNGFFIRIP